MLFEVGVGPVDADPVGGEEADAEDEVVDGLGRAHREGDGQGLPGHEDVTLVASLVEEADARDLHLAAAPAPLAVGPSAGCVRRARAPRGRRLRVGRRRLRAPGRAGPPRRPPRR